MSDSPSSPDFEGLIEEQIQKCSELLADISEYAIEQGSDPEIFQLLDDYFERLDQATKACLEDRFRTAELYNYLRYIFRGIASERGYHDKLQRETTAGVRTEDSVVNTYRWFKLYATVILNEKIDFPYSATIEDLNTYREDYITHPTDLPSPDQEADPMLLSTLLLIWNSLEDVLRTWARILEELDDEDFEDRKRILSDQVDFHIGFVDTILEDHGYITSFQNGEQGESIRIQPSDFDFFAKEGDIVILETERNSYNSLVPVRENGSGVRKYPTDQS